MPGVSHETMIKYCRERPNALRCLLSLLPVGTIAGFPPLADSVVRGKPVELRPDFLFAAGKDGPWTGCELQHQIDEAKVTSWPLLIAMLNHQRKARGDLIVLTPSRAVARWARSLGARRGPLGTSLHCVPTVIHVDETMVEQLLALNEPDAAVIAAWAMRNRKGPKALDVATRAVKIAAVEGGPLSEELREASLRAIIQVVSTSIAERVYALMTHEKTERHQSRLYKLVLADYRDAIEAAAQSASITAEANGRLLGLREAVRAVIHGRELPLTKTAAKHIDQCSDEKTLLLWHARALKAKATADVFAGPKTTRVAASKAPAKPARKVARKAPVAKRRAAKK